jgi:putative transcriptional regulator
MRGLAEMRDHMRGKIALQGRHVPDSVDVRAIRRRTGMTRPAFAARFGLDVRAVQDWEQGRRQPDRAARVLLTVILAEPQAIDRALLRR